MNSFDRNPIKSYDEFKSYCLRQLGDGVITVNVSDDQLEDCIRDSIKWAQEFLDEGNVQSIIAHKVDQNDLDRHYFQLDSSIIGVKDFLTENGSSNQMFTVSYMTKVGLIDALAHPLNGLSNYYFMKFNLAQMNMLINPAKPFRYDYNTNRLYLDINWNTTIVKDNYIIFVAWVAVDPVVNPNFFNNNFLKKYCIANIKRMWGQNLCKYSGIKLPGDTSLNGQAILDEANKDLENLKKEVEQYSSFSAPFTLSVLG